MKKTSILLNHIQIELTDQRILRSIQQYMLKTTGKL